MQAHMIEWNLPAVAVKAMESHDFSQPNYEMHSQCCQAIRYLTDGKDAKANERRQCVADAGAIPLLLAAIKAYPETALPKGKGKNVPVHLHDHAVASIRNITAASDELSRKAREAGARKEWIGR